MQQLVSIIVPIYNTESYLPQCLDSIIHQTYRHLEIILINDGSKDHSLAIAQSYAEKDDRIVLIDKANEGVAATRNLGLKNAHGEYVLYVDSDDWIESNMVEFLLEKSIANDSPIVTCEKVLGKIEINDIIRKYNHLQTIELFLHHKELDGSLWSKLLKRSLLNDLTFDSTVGYGEDALFFWNVLKKNQVGIFYTNYPLYHYRMNDSSISHVFGKQKFAAHQVWTQITADVERLYPQYLPLAKAQFCNQMAVILYEAALCKYPFDEQIKQIQAIVRHNINLLKPQLKCSIKKNIAAFLLAWGYRYISFFS